MKGVRFSEKIFLEELSEIAQGVQNSTRELPIGSFIKMIRTQLGMTQKMLSKKAGIPQSTLSRIEKGEKDTYLSTIRKILKALFCDLVILPKLKESIDRIRRKQAKKQAEKQIRYLKGTMNLEGQEPDSRLIQELLKQEEERLLHGPGSELWKE